MVTQNTYFKTLQKNKPPKTNKVKISNNRNKNLRLSSYFVQIITLKTSFIKKNI